MISRSILENKIRTAWFDAQYSLTEDVREALERAEREEQLPIARLHFAMNLRSLATTSTVKMPLCGDTGMPVYFVIFGEQAIGAIEGGLATVFDVCRDAVRHATLEIPLRQDVVDSFTREERAGNLGVGFPHFYQRIRPNTDFIEITAISIGGGPELMGQAAMVMLSIDGVKGIQKFVVENVVRTDSGTNCNPQVVGIGVGGSMDIACGLAKQAALLRYVGERNPRNDLAELEEELLQILNDLDIGPWGLGGKATVMDVHIETVESHVASLPVAVYMHCPAMRRKTLRFYADGRVEEGIHNSWFQRTQYEFGTSPNYPAAR
jgi:tartrate/fumarate subfamily iron-sulfur-dependent hydro-lyase alpha chain